MSNIISSIVRVALADLRGDFRRFWLLIACVALGVGTMSMVGSVGSALQSALARDARVLLGGDIEARLTDRRANAEERAAMERLGRVAEVIDVMARVHGEDGQGVLAAVRAVDSAYPLLGTIEPADAAPPAQRLSSEGNGPGALVAPGLLERLGLSIGDRLALGETWLTIRGTVASLPDQVSQGIAIGYPVLVSVAAIDAAGVLAPGSLARYRYKVDTGGRVDFDRAARDIAAVAPEAGWRFSAPGDATDELASYYGMFRRFLSIIGLSVMIVGGVGVANAVSAYVLERQRSIATMRALGATGLRLVLHFLIQIFTLTVLGTAIGAGAAVVATWFALPLIGPAVGLALQPTVDIAALGLAAVFGVLVSFLFAYLPLARIRLLRPALLFRALGPAPRRRGWRDMLKPEVGLPVLVSLGLIALVATLDVGRADVVLWYGLGVALAVVLLRVASRLIRRGLESVPPVRAAAVRNAIRAACRPGSPASAVILSLGLGVSLLLVIALTADNLQHQLDPSVRVDAPSLVYLDLFDDEVAALADFSASTAGIESFESLPVLRATGLLLNDRPPPPFSEPPKDMSLYFGDEIPLTWSAAVPRGSRLSTGAWWGEGYSGPPLVAPSDDIGRQLGLKIGDVLTFTVYGEPVSATVVGFRHFEWQRGGVNFPYVLSPGALDGFPQSSFGLLKIRTDGRAETEAQLAAAFPDLVFLPIDEAVGAVRALIASVATAVGLVGAVALAGGVLVLAGALANGRRQREADSIVARVLGATTGDIVRLYLIEYGVIGLMAALLAALLGVAGAWALVTIVLESAFRPDLLLLVGVVAATLGLTLVTGIAATWSALSARPATRLRET